MGDIDGLANDIFDLIVASKKGFGFGAATLVGALAGIIVHESQGDPQKSKMLCGVISGELFRAVEKGNTEPSHPNLN